MRRELLLGRGAIRGSPIDEIRITPRTLRPQVADGPCGYRGSTKPIPTLQCSMDRGCSITNIESRRSRGTTLFLMKSGYLNRRTRGKYELTRSMMYPAWKYQVGRDTWQIRRPACIAAAARVCRLKYPMCDTRKCHHFH